MIDSPQDTSEELMNIEKFDKSCDMNVNTKYDDCYQKVGSISLKLKE